jgi:hypothetical protein
MKSLFLVLTLMTGLQTIKANILIKGFEGSLEGNTTVIKWDLEAPSYTATAILEKSDDGILFTPVKIFDVLTSTNRGSFLDSNLGSGIYYYRLRITKTGYTPLISRIVSIKITEPVISKTEFRIVNPVRAQLSAWGVFTVGRPMLVELTDLGVQRKIILEVVPVTGQLITISATSIPKGWYILKIMDKYSGRPVVTKTIYKQ